MSSQKRKAEDDAIEQKKDNNKRQKRDGPATRRLHWKSRQRLELLALGLCDEESAFDTLVRHKLFDRNIVTQLLKPFFIDCWYLLLPRPLDVVSHAQNLYVLTAEAYPVVSGSTCQVQVFSADGEKWRGQLADLNACCPRETWAGLNDVMALDTRSEFLYIANRSRNSVFQVPLNGQFISKFGPTTDAGFTGMACDSSTGRVYACTGKDDSIRQFSASGVPQRVFDTDGRLSDPYRMCVDSAAQELFVANHSRHCVSVFSTRDGSFLRSFGCRSQPQLVFYDNGRFKFEQTTEEDGSEPLRFPTAIALHPTRPEIVVADQTLRLRLYDRRTGVFLRNLDDYAEPIRAVAIDTNTRDIYVCLDNRVRCLRGLLLP